MRVLLYIYLVLYMLVDTNAQTRAYDLNERPGKKEVSTSQKDTVYVKTKTKTKTITINTLIMPLGPIIGGALIGGATSLTNTLLQSSNNRQNQQYAVRNWNMQNEYNAPIKQVERMKQAGLNPALMYQGSPQNVAQSVNAPRREAYKIPDNLFADIYAKMAGAEKNIGQTVPPQVTINNVLSGTEKNKESAELSRVQAGKLAQESDKILNENRLNTALFETNVSYRKEQLRNIEKQNIKLEKELEYMTPIQKATLDNLLYSYRQSVLQTRKLKNEVWIQENNQKLQELGVNPNGSNMVDTVLRFIILNGAKFLKGD